jgi:hypothetical protein
MNFQEQIKLLEQDNTIINYFQNRNILDFIKTYIQVDTLVNTSKDIQPNYIHQQLSHIQEYLSRINNHLTNDIKQQLHDSLHNITNNEIRNMITNIQNNKEENLKLTLENFNEKLINLNTQNLNEFDRKSLNIIQNIQSIFNNSLDSHNISHKIQSIDTTLNLLHNTFTNNSSKKGEFAENILFNNLIKAFPSSDITNTSQTPNCGDIIIKKDSKPNILIDSKNFQTNVPKIDLEKFYRDCELNNCSGILCNVNSGIANKEHFQIDIQDSKIFIYIANHEFDNTLFQLAVKIIYHIHEIIKNNKTNIIEIDKELFERIKIEFNFYNQTFKQHLNIIKQNITSLEQLAMVQLEQFFKRSNFNELKPFSCSSCGAGYGSSKTLKKHMIDKHGIKITSKKEKKLKEQSDHNTNDNNNNDNDNDNDNDDNNDNDNDNDNNNDNDNDNDKKELPLPDNIRTF